MSRTPSEPDSLPPIGEAIPNRWVTVPLGLFVGGLATLLTAVVLAVAFTMGPFSRLLGFDEFDVLLVIGLPIISLPGGAIAGAVLGSLRGYKNAYRYSMLCAVIPAVIYFLLGISQQELSKTASTQFVSVTSVAFLMITSAVVGLLVVAKLFRWLARRKRGGSSEETPINLDLQ